MVIYTEFLNRSDTSIDQPQPMLLATSEAEFGQASVVDTGTYGAVASAITTCKVHLPVDQVVVRCWSNEAFVGEVGPHDAFEDSEVLFMVVVVQCHWAKVYVIWVIRWAVYHLVGDVSRLDTLSSWMGEAYDWTPKAIGVLGRVMRMVKCTTVRSGFESVCKTPTRR